MKTALDILMPRWVLLAMLVAVPGARADLSEALNTNLTWTTSPTHAWAEVLEITHDGESAAQSSPVGVGEQSWLRTTVTGPGQLRFYWKVYSDEGFGFLRLKVGTNTLEITGDVEWAMVNFPLLAGTQTVEWVYEILPGGAMSGDAGWLDEVEFMPGPTPPFLYRSPAGTDVVAGVSVVLNSLALGSETLRYQWQLNGTNIPGATSPVYAIPSIFTSHAGQYRVIVTNNYGAVTSDVAMVTVTVDPLAEAVNSPRLIWATTEYAPWEATALESHDEVSSAWSAAIGDDEDSRLSTTVQGPGELTFWWRVSSEADFDVFQFTTNGTYVTDISGIEPWQKFTLTIPPGPIELEWAYLKDGSRADGDDAGWLDEVTFVPSLPPLLVGPAWAGGTFRVSVATLVGKNYVLEYQNAVGGTNWTALPAVAGDGTVKTLSDSSATGSRRFYRLRQQ